MVLDCLGVAPPPCSQGTRFPFRPRLLTHNIDTILLERPVALAESTGGRGEATTGGLGLPPLIGAGRVEETRHLLGHALRKAVGLAAEALDLAAAAVVDLAWGEPKARERALGLVLDEVAQWQRWLAQQQSLAAQDAPLKAVMETLTQSITQDTEPDPEGGPDGRRIKKAVAPERRIALADTAMRHGRNSSAQTCNGFQEPAMLILTWQGVRGCQGTPPERREGPRRTQEAVMTTL